MLARCCETKFLQCRALSFAWYLGDKEREFGSDEAVVRDNASSDLQSDEIMYIRAGPDRMFGASSRRDISTSCGGAEPCRASSR